MNYNEMTKKELVNYIRDNLSVINFSYSYFMRKTKESLVQTIVDYNNFKSLMASH